MVISQKCHSRIQNLKLTSNFKGGAQAFVTQLQNALLDLEYCTGTEKNDLEKKTTLLCAIEDPHYHSIRDHLAIDTTKTYDTCLVALDQHATMFMSRDKNANRRLTRAEREKAGKGKGKLGKQPKNPPLKQPKNRTAAAQQQQDTPSGALPSIEQSIWNSLPKAVQAHIADHNRKIRQGRQNDHRQPPTPHPTRGNGNEHPNGRRNNAVRFEEQETPPENNNEADQQEDSQEEETTSIRNIMRGNRRNNALISAKQHKPPQPPTDDMATENALIDFGTDTTCLGPAFKVISTTNRTVNVIGYDDTMVKHDLQVGDGITLATNDQGQNVLLCFNEAIIN